MKSNMRKRKPKWDVMECVPGGIVVCGYRRTKQYPRLLASEIAVSMKLPEGQQTRSGGTRDRLRSMGIALQIAKYLNDHEVTP